MCELHVIEKQPVSIQKNESCRPTITCLTSFAGSLAVKLLKVVEFDIAVLVNFEGIILFWNFISEHLPSKYRVFCNEF
jgi:hypothetical protein